MRLAGCGKLKRVWEVGRVWGRGRDEMTADGDPVWTLEVNRTFIAPPPPTRRRDTVGPVLSYNSNRGDVTDQLEKSRLVTESQLVIYAILASYRMLAG
jgi:hypothetical protein